MYVSIQQEYHIIVYYIMPRPGGSSKDFGAEIHHTPVVSSCTTAVRMVLLYNKYNMIDLTGRCWFVLEQNTNEPNLTHRNTPLLLTFISNVSYHTHHIIYTYICTCCLDTWYMIRRWYSMLETWNACWTSLLYYCYIRGTYTAGE